MPSVVLHLKNLEVIEKVDYIIVEKHIDVIGVKHTLYSILGPIISRRPANILLDYVLESFFVLFKLSG